MSINGINSNIVDSNNNIPVRKSRKKPDQIPTGTTDNYMTSGSLNSTTGNIDISKAAEILTKNTKKTPEMCIAEMNWSLPTPDGIVGKPILVDENHLVFSSFNKAVTCINPATREVIWEMNLIPAGKGETINNLVVKGPDNDILASFKYGSNVISIDPATGKEKSRIDLKNEIVNEPIIGADGNIHIQDNRDNKIITFNGKTKKKMHETPIPSNAGLQSAIDKEGTVYVRTQNGSICAIEKGTGKEKWTYKPDTFMLAGMTPAISGDGIIYCPCDQGKLHAIDSKTGEKKWQFTAGNVITRNGFIKSPVIGKQGEVLITSMDHHVYCLDPKTGKENWKFKTDNLSMVAPRQLTDGTVYVSDITKKIYGLDIKTGSVKWSAKTPGEVKESPDSDKNGNFYIGCDDKHLYSYKTPHTHKTGEELMNEVDSDHAKNQEKDASIRHEDNFVVIGGIKLPKKQTVK